MNPRLLKNNKYLIFLTFCFVFSGCAWFAPRDVQKADSSTKSLNLNRKDLRTIPDEVFELKDLEELRLFQTNLTEISPRIGELKNLKKLYIGRNELRTLPKEIGELHDLEVLFIHFNEIDSLPSSIKGLKKLEHLKIDNNNLKRLPDEIGALPNLKTLTVQFNELDTIQPALFDSGSIEILDLRYNQIRHIPTEIGNLTNLHELYLSNAGFLLTLPDELCNIRRFDILQVDRSIQIPRCLFVRSLHNFKIVYD